VGDGDVVALCGPQDCLDRPFEPVTGFLNIDKSIFTLVALLSECYVSVHTPPRTVIGKVAAILSAFQYGRQHSVTEIARLTGLPVSTAHRILWDLAACHVLQRTDEGQFQVGLTLQRLSGNIGIDASVRDRAAHVLTNLSSVTGRRARLGVLRDGRVAYIEKLPGSEPATRFCASATLPAHATALGKALLAFASRGTVAAVAQNLIVYSAKTLDTPERLHRALRLIRISRQAVACGELVDGEVAVATPVFGPGGTVLAALELEVSDIRTELELSWAVLAVAAEGLSRELSADSLPALDARHLTGQENGSTVTRPVPIRVRVNSL
jgi:DNA-binding IclR family transcriptional regulator